MNEELKQLEIELAKVRLAKEQLELRDALLAARREQQADNGGEGDKRHHARLEEREVVFYPRCNISNTCSLEKCVCLLHSKRGAFCNLCRRSTRQQA